MTSEASRTTPARERITAPVTYIVETGDKPYVHTAALTGGLPRFFAEFETREVAIENARPLAGGLSIDRQGFELRRHASEMGDFYDDAEVEGVYVPEVERLLMEATGARRVLVFDHTRRGEQRAGQPGFREPAARVHNDYTPWSGADRIRHLLGEDEAAGRRIAQVNVWRPIRGPVERMPLALLDASSVAPEDLVATDHVYPDRVGEIYHVARSPAHRWYYFPRMQADEVVLIKGYDTAEDGRARFTPHTAFDDPTAPGHARPRESIELRTLLVF